MCRHKLTFVRVEFTSPATRHTIDFMPTLKIQLDGETHRKFKVWCAEYRESMQGIAAHMIADHVSWVEKCRRGESTVGDGIASMALKYAHRINTPTKESES